MRKSVSPGSWLELTGSFELGATLAEREATPILSAYNSMLVLDRESGDHVGLGDLLRSFLADPTERITGPIRITIEPLRQDRPFPVSAAESVTVKR